MQQEKKQSEKQEVERKVKPDLRKPESPLHAGQAPEMEAQGIIGNHGSLLRIGDKVIQAKLKVSQPGDKYEQEADKMAEEVEKLKEGGMPERPLREKITQINANELNSSEVEGIEQESIEQRIEANRGNGQPLSGKILNQMNRVIGVDFSDARIHTDREAVQLNESIQAHAFTEGKDIYFNEGKYEPETAGGNRLLVHELGHVVQQGKNYNSSSITSIQREEKVKEQGEEDILQEYIEKYQLDEPFIETLKEIVGVTSDIIHLLEYFGAHVPHLLARVANVVLVFDIVDIIITGLMKIGEANLVAYDWLKGKAGAYAVVGWTYNDGLIWDIPQSDLESFELRILNKPEKAKSVWKEATEKTVQSLIQCYCDNKIGKKEFQILIKAASKNDRNYLAINIYRNYVSKETPAMRELAVKEFPINYPN